MDYFVNILTFFGSIFSFVLASGQLMLRKKSAGNYIICGLFFCIGVWLFHAGIVFSGIIQQIPHLRYIHVPLIYFVGPLVYLYYKLIIDSNFRFHPKWILHFLPGFISATVLLVPFYLENAAFKIEFAIYEIVYQQQYLFESLYVSIVVFIIILPKVSIILYLMYLMINGSVFLNLNLSRQGRALQIILLLIIVNIATASISLLGDLFSWKLVKLSTVMTTLILCVLYLLGQRYPAYLQILKQEMRKRRYDQSRIKGLNIEDILKRLHEIMMDEKAFADEDVSLVRLADDLAIHTHQLSQILNERFNKNLHSFVNEYRIDEAMQMLVTEPERSVLSVALAVGFNSKSAFNAAFTRFTGMTPSSYRRKYRG